MGLHSTLPRHFLALGAAQNKTMLYVVVTKLAWKDGGPQTMRVKLT